MSIYIGIHVITSIMFVFLYIYQTSRAQTLHPRMRAECGFPVLRSVGVASRCAVWRDVAGIVCGCGVVGINCGCGVGWVSCGWYMS